MTGRRWETAKDQILNVNIEKYEHIVSANVCSFLMTSNALTNVTHIVKYGKNDADLQCVF